MVYTKNNSATTGFAVYYHLPEKGYKKINLVQLELNCSPAETDLFPEICFLCKLFQKGINHQRLCVYDDHNKCCE